MEVRGRVADGGGEVIDGGGPEGDGAATTFRIRGATSVSVGGVMGARSQARPSALNDVVVDGTADLFGALAMRTAA